MKIERLHDALIVVDVQVDFCPGGALPVPEGDQIVPIINRLTPLFTYPIFTRDWHPENHCSFSKNPQFIDKSWPVHCVQNTPGAAFHPQLIVPNDAIIINKGTQPDKEAYSGFEDTPLENILKEKEITRLFICGLATDYCVKATAIDAAQKGFNVLLIQDACRGVNIPEGSVQQAIETMRSKGIKICSSDEID